MEAVEFGVVWCGDDIYVCVCMYACVCMYVYDFLTSQMMLYNKIFGEVIIFAVYSCISQKTNQRAVPFAFDTRCV